MPENLKLFLSSCKIPFLSSVNQDPPIPSNWDEDFCLGRYQRCANKTEIDGRFDYLLNGQPSIATCECKNYFDTIASTELKESLGKAKKAGSKLCLVVATKFSENPEDPFFQYCRENRINLYRVRRQAPDNYRTLLSFFEFKEMCCQNSELNALVFESHSINNYSQ